MPADIRLVWVRTVEGLSLALLLEGEPGASQHSAQRNLNHPQKPQKDN
jgi:hypothetical protein